MRRSLPAASPRKSGDTSRKTVVETPCRTGLGWPAATVDYAAVDLTGHGARDVLLTTMQEGTYKAYLYRSGVTVPLSQKRSAGTGLNFTLY